jgi:RNA polymerase sigma-70 factor (ECF subfamily)
LTDSGFVSFFRERFSRTVVLLITMGASQADAEDATQEAMVLAWQKWDSIDTPAAWVRTVAVRAYWRLVRTRPQTVSLDEFVPESIADPSLSIFTEEQQHVLRLLRALPPMQRTVVALAYDASTCEEIAMLLGISEATVRSHLRHARKNLKGMMS